MKIYITGSTGSGKTTAALELSQRYGIPAYSLDEIVWDNSGGFTGTRYSEEVRDGRIVEMLGLQSWVAEGIYSSEWMLPVLHAVDFVLILTPPRFVRDSRLVKRYIQSKFRNGLQTESLVSDLEGPEVGTCVRERQNVGIDRSLESGKYQILSVFRNKRGGICFGGNPPTIYSTGSGGTYAGVLTFRNETEERRGYP